MSSSSRTHAPWLKFESFMSSPWPSTCVRSLHLDPPFLLLALPSAPFPLPQLPEVCGKPAQLLQREYGLYRRVLLLHKRRRASELWQRTISVVRTSMECGCHDFSWNPLTRRKNDLQKRRVATSPSTLVCWKKVHVRHCGRQCSSATLRADPERKRFLFKHSAIHICCCTLNDTCDGDAPPMKGNGS